MHNTDSERLSGGWRKVFLTILLLAGLVVAGITPATAATANNTDGGDLRRSLENRPETITIKLVGVPSYEMTDLFYRLLCRLDGVETIRPYHYNLSPNHPQACIAEWRLTITGGDIFKLESDIYQQLKKLAAGQGRELSRPGLELSREELISLAGIKPRQASARSLTFVQTLSFARNRDTGWPDRYSCPDCAGPFNHGFE